MNLLNLQAIAKEVTNEVITLLTEEEYTEDNEYRAKALISGITTLTVGSPARCQAYKGKFFLSWIDKREDSLDNIENLKVVFDNYPITREHYAGGESACTLTLF